MSKTSPFHDCPGCGRKTTEPDKCPACAAAARCPDKVEPPPSFSCDWCGHSVPEVGSVINERGSLTGWACPRCFGALTGHAYKGPGAPVGKVAEAQKVDVVNHPPHYNQGGIECIDALEAALTPEEFRGHCKACAVKYAWRERHKGGDESLEKAVWYLQRALAASKRAK